MRIFLAIFFTIAFTALSSNTKASEFADQLDQFIQSPEGFRHIRNFLTLPENRPELQIRSADLIRETEVNRIYQITLKGDFVAPIRFQISIPVKVNNFTDKSSMNFPTVVLLGGIHTGDQILNLIENQDQVIVVSFNYPLEKPLAEQPVEDILKAIYETPKQVSSLLFWLSQQSWVNKFQLHAMGVSLGTLFLPLSQRISQNWGTYLNSSIFAYGGADIKSFIRFGFEKDLDAGQMQTLLDGLQIITAFLEPTNHLATLQGRFLVIEGTEEEVFSQWSLKKLRTAVPHPKEIRYIEGPHISSKRLDLIQKLGIEVNAWLTQLGVY